MYFAITKRFLEYCNIQLIYIINWNVAPIQKKKTFLNNLTDTRDWKNNILMSILIDDMCDSPQNSFFKY